jgi:hypothetical protein
MEELVELSDGEDHEEPVRPQSIAVYMLFVNVSHFNHLAYATITRSTMHPSTTSATLSSRKVVMLMSPMLPRHMARCSSCSTSMLGVRLPSTFVRSWDNITPSS